MQLLWAQFQNISIAVNLRYTKNKVYKTLNYWSRDLLNFDFLEKDLGIVSSPHFVNYFSRKIFLLLYFINWPNFILWLPLFHEILGNMCIAVIFFPGCDVRNFESTLIFVIQPFFFMTKKSRKKFKYQENENSF